MRTPAGHWDAVHADRGSTDVSWYEADPSTSLRLVTGFSEPGDPVVDVGGGASLLVDALLDRGWRDVTVLDVSAYALAEVQGRLDNDREIAAGVQLAAADVLTWRPRHRYGVWHDRALFHFLTTPEGRDGYARAANRAVEPGGVVIIGAFALDGPTACSGLPVQRYDAEELAAQFAPGFELVHQERQQHTTPSGSTQPLTWVVLRHIGGSRGSP